MGAKPNSNDRTRSSSPLDARKQALAEQEAKVNQAIARRQKLIEAAPKMAEEAARIQREELLKRKSSMDPRSGTRILIDTRRVYEVAAEIPARPLRKHRNQGMFTFFLLCIILAGVLFWLYCTMLRGG